MQDLPHQRTLRCRDPRVQSAQRRRAALAACVVSRERTQPQALCAGGREQARYERWCRSTRCRAPAVRVHKRGVVRDLRRTPRRKRVQVEGKSGDDAQGGVPERDEEKNDARGPRCAPGGRPAWRGMVGGSPGEAPARREARGGEEEREGVGEVVHERDGVKQLEKREVRPASATVGIYERRYCVWKERTYMYPWLASVFSPGHGERLALPAGGRWYA